MSNQVSIEQVEKDIDDTLDNYGARPDEPDSEIKAVETDRRRCPSRWSKRYDGLASTILSACSSAFLE